MVSLFLVLALVLALVSAGLFESRGEDDQRNFLNDLMCVTIDNRNGAYRAQGKFVPVRRISGSLAVLESYVIMRLEQLVIVVEVELDVVLEDQD